MRPTLSAQLRVAAKISLHHGWIIYARKTRCFPAVPLRGRPFLFVAPQSPNALVPFALDLREYLLEPGIIRRKKERRALRLMPPACALARSRRIMSQSAGHYRKNDGSGEQNCQHKDDTQPSRPFMSPNLAPGTSAIKITIAGSRLLKNLIVPVHRGGGRAELGDKQTGNCICSRTEQTGLKVGPTMSERSDALVCPASAAALHLLSRA
jgi:hypothetical protein